MKKIETPPLNPNGKFANGVIEGNLEEIRHLAFGEKGYLYWDKIKYKQLDTETTPEGLWHAVKFFRRGKSQKIKFGKYDFHFVPEVFSERLHFFDRTFGGNIPNESGFEENKKIYLRQSILEESITSSQIEGAITTRLKAQEMLEKQQTPRNKSEQMIANNYATIQHIYEHKKEDLTPENLLEIHRLITDKTLDKQEEGRFRETNNVRIIDSTDGEIAHIPPPFDEIPAFVQQLCDFFNESERVPFIHPIIKASIIHFMIGYFHPFSDGNGRTARALFYWYLLKNGYALTEYLSISKVILDSRTQYYKSFLYVENDENDLSYFIDYQLKTLDKAYQKLISYIRERQKQDKDLLLYQQTEGVNLRQAEILQWINENPNLVLTAKEIENRMQVSNQTARTDLAGLIKLGYLQEMAVNKKEKRYINNESKK